ncbi:hypothetical protein LWI29_027223 [Acer saccharum]|uniref:RNase H type-1 domain-containing protein n=1 Tax=Acer saccharum TaxID=4024 RepID=A0AA39W2Z7_ACESA|nr:hypothetical protein LWI29_027223 [Acer saccharum]
MEQKNVLLSALGVGVGLGLASSQTMNKWTGNNSALSNGVTAEKMEQELLRQVVEGRESKITFDEFPYYLRREVPRGEENKCNRHDLNLESRPKRKEIAGTNDYGSLTRLVGMPEVSESPDFAGPDEMGNLNLNSNLNPMRDRRGETLGTNEYGPSSWADMGSKSVTGPIKQMGPMEVENPVNGVVNDVAGHTNNLMGPNIMSKYPPESANIIGDPTQSPLIILSQNSTLVKEPQQMVKKGKVVELVRKGTPYDADVGPIIEEISNVLKALPSCFISHVPRKGNVMAYVLAKKALSVESEYR